MGSWVDKIKDEYHFVLICPYYNDLRQIFIKRYFQTRTSMYEIISLLNTTKLKDLNNLAKILIYAFKLRSLRNFFPLNVASERIFHFVNIIKVTAHIGHINVHIYSHRLYICMYDNELCYA